MKTIDITGDDIAEVKTLRCGNISFGNIAKETGISKGTVYRIVSNRFHKKPLVPACAIHGPECEHRCKPDKPKRKRKPGWKVWLDIKCDCGGYLSIICYSNKTETIEIAEYVCDDCGKEKSFELQTKYRTIT